MASNRDASRLSNKIKKFREEQKEKTLPDVTVSAAEESITPNTGDDNIAVKKMAYLESGFIRLLLHAHSECLKVANLEKNHMSSTHETFSNHINLSNSICKINGNADECDAYTQKAMDSIKQLNSPGEGSLLGCDNIEATLLSWVSHQSY